MGTITDRQINAKPDTKDRWLNETVIWGHGSLSARITPSGERSFYFRYVDSSKKQDRLSIGSYSREEREGYLTLTQARLRAKELAALHKSGIRDIRFYLEDQEAHRKAQQQAEIMRLKKETQEYACRKTVTELFEHWATVDLIRRKDCGDEMRRLFKKDILPLIGHIAAEDIRKRHVTEVTDALLSRGVPRMAKVAFASMRQMFRFAVDRDIIEADPTASIRKVNIGGKDTERDRVLSDDEIRRLSNQIPEAGLLETTEAAVWISLSTCCRIGELLTAEWKHIDLNKGQWLIPAEASKNGKPHTVYLSQFSVRQFERIQCLTGDTPWCYPNRDSSGPVCTKTITKQLTDRQRPDNKERMSGRSKKSQALLMPAGKWTPHDLRRTGATLMVKAGVLPEVAERCLNHTEENKIKRTYQRHNYAREMNEAWYVLGDRLELLTGTNTEKVVTPNFSAKSQI